MTATPTRRLATPEEIAVQAGQQVAFLRLPERATVFAEREMRLRQLATRHPMGDFLQFIAELAHAQHESLLSYPAVALPDAAAIEQASQLGVPPLPADGWKRDPLWRGELRKLLQRLIPRIDQGPTASAVQVMRRLLDLDDDALELQADRLLNGVMLGLDLATAPLIGAALQVYWTQLLLSTQAAHGGDRLAPFGRTDHATLCPCCGSRPTASIARIGAEANGYRYLHCSLCSAQWHMVRIKCTNCESTKGIQYQALQPADADDSAKPERSAVQAETCSECMHYLKIVHMERDQNVEPVADDLASLTLDLLVADTGLQRHGVNLMLLFGDPDESPPPGAS
jgi:FdhE protein